MARELEQRQEVIAASSSPAAKKRRKKKARKRQTDAVYMDNRSVVRNSGQELVRACADWKAWSDSTRLKENWSKLQFMGRTKEQQQELREACVELGYGHWTKHVCEEAEVLGTSITRDGMPGKQQLQRVEKFQQRLALLASIPWKNRFDYMSAVRAHANPVVSYGWVSAAPREELMNTLAAKVWACKRVGLRGAAKYLKWLAEGAMTHLATVIPCRLLGIVTKMVQSGEVEWRAPPHTAVSILKRMLKNLHWVISGPFRWQHQIAGESDIMANLRRIDTFKAKANHQIRESFRAKMWEIFVATTKRHEILQMDEYPMYNEKRAKSIR